MVHELSTKNLAIKIVSSRKVVLLKVHDFFVINTDYRNLLNFNGLTINHIDPISGKVLILIKEMFKHCVILELYLKDDKNKVN